MPRIVVSGHSSFHAPAERGTVRIGVGLIGDQREAVLQRAGQLHTLVAEQARQHVEAGRATWWGADNVVASVREEWLKPQPHLDAVKVRRFWAGADVRVKFRDFAALASWCTQVALLEGVSIGAVTWALTDARREGLVRQVRTQAAQDAAVRAQAFADALGLGPVRLVTLFEDGLRPDVGEVAAVLGVTGRAYAASSNADGFQVRPEDIEVSATVTADFDADAPA